MRGVKERLNLHRRTPSWTKTGSSSNLSPLISEKKLSGSDFELHSTQGKINSFISDSNIRSHCLSENPLAPEVTGISPREGPLEGGQRVILRGTCLGECTSDVLRVIIAGVDCTQSLEYHSQGEY